MHKQRTSSNGRHPLTTLILHCAWAQLMSTAPLFLQETGRVEKHIEMWDVEPGRVLKRLLKPASKTPTSRWETFMLSVHEGDVKGMWLAASAPILTYSAPIVGVSLLTKALTGHGLPVSYLALLKQSIDQ